MTQMTSNEFEAVTWSRLGWTLTRGSIGCLWRQASRCVATMVGELRRSAQRQSEQMLPPPNLWQHQCRRDILRIEARRML